MIREPAPAPPKGYRPHMPLSVKLEATLRWFGVDPASVQFDHDPALGLRVWDPVAGDTIPPANDPNHIRPKFIETHRDKTSGKKTRTSGRGADVTEIARTRKAADGQRAFVARLLAKGTEEPPGPPRRGRKMPSRPFRRKAQ